MLSAMKKFTQLEAAGGLVLLAMFVFAMLAANSPVAPYYELLHGHDARLVINEGLIAIFFLAIGIEIKLEMREGALSKRSQMALPLVSACGGVILPALIFTYINWGGEAMRGWAVPAATDIVFSLGVLSMFGAKVPVGLRIFLLGVAVFDDLIAIGIIAVFYSEAIKIWSLVFALACCVLIAAYNKRVTLLTPFVFAGAALWVALLDAGVSPTVAGVVLGLAMPVEMGKRVFRFLHVKVTYGIVPLFVFANSGVRLEDVTMAAFTNQVSLGVMFGLFFGKQWGIFGSAALLIKLRWAKLPSDASWGQLYAVALIAGIGFTMSLFIGTLAYGANELMTFTKVGVLTGSLASAAAGIICMALTSKKPKSGL